MRLIDKEQDYRVASSCLNATVKVYPNPANASSEESIIAIVSENKTVAPLTRWDLEVYDKYQRIYKVEGVKSPAFTLNTKNWEPGIYFIRVHYQDVVLSEKLIISE